MAQVALHRNYSQAVVVLRRQARYGGLNESTVWGWSIKGSYTELTPDTLVRRARAAEGRNGLGPSRHTYKKGGLLADHPAVLGAIKDELVHMRKAGIALGVPIARVLIKNKVEELMPQLLKPAGPLGVGKTWTTRFLTRELDWSHR